MGPPGPSRENVDKSIGALVAPSTPESPPAVGTSRRTVPAPPERKRRQELPRAQTAVQGVHATKAQAPVDHEPCPPIRPPTHKALKPAVRVLQGEEPVGALGVDDVSHAQAARRPSRRASHNRVHAIANARASACTRGSVTARSVSGTNAFMMPSAPPCSSRSSICAAIGARATAAASPRREAEGGTALRAGAASAGAPTPRPRPPPPLSASLPRAPAASGGGTPGRPSARTRHARLDAALARRLRDDDCPRRITVAPPLHPASRAPGNHVARVDLRTGLHRVGSAQSQIAPLVHRAASHPGHAPRGYVLHVDLLPVGAPAQRPRRLCPPGAATLAPAIRTCLGDTAVRWRCPPRTAARPPSPSPLPTVPHRLSRWKPSPRLLPLRLLSALSG
eukprot:6206406-Pleurochrysis_carterae.AAC.1